MIPGFDEVKKVSLEAGALGSGISGSGPSIFAFSKGEETALKVRKVMKSVYEKIGIAYEIHISKINMEGVKPL